MVTRTYSPFMTHSHIGRQRIRFRRLTLQPSCVRVKHIANHSVPSGVISDRGANLMSDEVKSFLESLGARKYETTPYKPSSNGSVERFHRFLTSAISHCIGKGTDQNQWDEHLDTVLLTYRVLPIDGLDVSPFEIIYGRGPNLPIDNILFRENYTTPVQTLEEYFDMLHETQLNSTCTKL